MRLLFVLLLLFTSTAQAQFFTTSNPFVQTGAAFLPFQGCSDITQTDDGRCFVLFDVNKVCEIDLTTLTVLRTISFSGVTPTGITLWDSEAICYVESDGAGNDLFAILHEGSSTIFWLWIPDTGNPTVPLPGIEFYAAPVPTPTHYEAMHRDPVNHDVLTLTVFRVTSSTPVDAVVQVDVTRDGVNPISHVVNPRYDRTDIGVAGNPFSDHYSVRGTYSDLSLTPNLLAINRTGSGLKHAQERNAFGDVISFQKLNIGEIALEGILPRNVVGGQELFIVIDTSAYTTRFGIYKFFRPIP